MKKKLIILCVIIIVVLCGCSLSKNNIVTKSQKIIEEDLSDNISIDYCMYNSKENMAYLKFYSDRNGNDKALIKFDDNKIYYESVCSRINKNDYDKIIEYGDYILVNYQILNNNNDDWQEIDTGNNK